MKVLEETPERLVLEDRPVLLAYLLAGAILISAFLATSLIAAGDWTGLAMALIPAGFGMAFAVFVERVRLTFDRTAGRVTIDTVSVRRRTTDTIGIARLRHAATQSYQRRSRPGRSITMSRPVLHVAGLSDPRPLVQAYTGGPSAAEAAAAINRWLGRDAAA